MKERQRWEMAPNPTGREISAEWKALQVAIDKWLHVKYARKMRIIKMHEVERKMTALALAIQDKLDRTAIRRWKIKAGLPPIQEAAKRHGIFTK